jgi:hypothetical protein
MTKKPKEYWVLYRAVITEEVQYSSDEEETRKFGYPIKDCIGNKEPIITKYGLRYIVYGENCKYDVLIGQLKDNDGYTIEIRTSGTAETGDVKLAIAWGIDGKIYASKIPSYIIKRILDAIKKFEFMRDAELARKEAKEAKKWVTRRLHQQYAKNVEKK